MYQMISLWYYYTSGCFAFYINATSTPTPKNGIRVHSHAFGGIGVLAWGGERLAAGRGNSCKGLDWQQTLSESGNNRFGFVLPSLRPIQNVFDQQRYDRAVALITHLIVCGWDIKDVHGP